MLLITTNALAEETRYIVTFGLKQSRISLGPFAHMKDSINATEFQIPVDKQFFDSIANGETLTENFRTGSLIINMSSWKIWVKDKKVVMVE